ncbi:MAG: hypothetical protein F6J87_24580 [Spirulina sp. SIO3F2]|nr:hypothetical protein [Spirulina sp. SIO3F2]
MFQVAIITSQCDLHADVVIQELESSNVKPVRINTENFITNCRYSHSWSMNGNTENSEYNFIDSKVNTQNIDVVWWRKPSDYHPGALIQNEWSIKYCQDETKALVKSWPGLFPEARWVNHFYNMQLPALRINQIPVAQQLGLKIPPTIISNDYVKLSEFLTQYPDSIVKPMVYSSFLHQDKQYACFTRPINHNLLEEMHDSIEIAPVFMQKRIHKQAEYRVTIIGRERFVCRINTEHLDNELINQDWRVTEPEKLTHTPDKLPDLYLEKLDKMLKIWDLNFGAFDIIKGDDDNLYFIELNPNGQWYWIEILTGMPMVKAMVNLIEELSVKAQI